MIRGQKMFAGTENIYLTVYRQKKSVCGVKSNKGQTEEGGRKKHWTVCKTQRRRGKENGGDRVSVLTSLGVLTSLEDSGESSVVVMVETVRPEP